MPRVELGAAGARRPAMPTTSSAPSPPPTPPRQTYVLKLARSGEDGDKVLLLIESGARFHTVEAMPPKADTPSNFTLKLRKHIRTRRLEAVTQLGVDRVLQLSFGSGPAACHLLLEFFAQVRRARVGCSAEAIGVRRCAGPASVQVEQVCCGFRCPLALLHASSLPSHVLATCLPPAPQGNVIWRTTSLKC